MFFTLYFSRKFIIILWTFSWSIYPVLYLRSRELYQIGFTDLFNPFFKFNTSKISLSNEITWQQALPVNGIAEKNIFFINIESDGLLIGKQLGHQTSKITGLYFVIWLHKSSSLPWQATSTLHHLLYTYNISSTPHLTHLFSKLGITEIISV